MSTPEALIALTRVARERTPNGAPAHDFLHVQRVARAAHRIAGAERANVTIAVASALLHELFNHPKEHPEAHLSGDVCAERAREVLVDLGWAPPHVEAITYAIRVHPFSRGVAPDTLEAKVLQDADRLDAIGAVGVARCFATCAAMGSPFYAEEDPFCRARPPDDKAFGVDHFFRKLLRIADGLHTETARSMAAERVRFMDQFLAQLEREIGD